MKSIILLLVFGGTVLTAWSQHFQYKHYNEKDGLSNNAVSCIRMDHEGFLWIGTAFGLNRFDGNAFEKFSNNPTDSTSIADNNIQAIFEDRNNRLWVGTNAGISLYHPPTRTFSNYAPDTAVLPQQGISFQALCDDDTGDIWVGTKNDLLIFNPATDQFRSSGWARYANAVAPVNGNHLRVIILGVIKKSKGALWILSTYGLFSVDTQTKNFTYYPYPGILDYHGSELNYADHNGCAWISTYYNGILCFNSKTGAWTNYHTPPEFSEWDNAKSVMPYSGDTLAYCSHGSVFLFDAVNKKTLAMPGNDLGGETFLKNAGCKTLIRYGDLLWVGTDNGLTEIKPASSSFNFVPLTAGENVTRVFKLPGDELLFSSTHQDYTTFLVKKDKLISPVAVSGGGILHSLYQYFAETRNRYCYLNSDEHFYKYDPKTNIATDIQLPPKINPRDSFDIRNMVVDRNNNIWIRTLSQGIMKYDATTHTISLVREIPFHSNKESNAMYYDSLSNTLWVAEEFNGVYVFDIGKNKLRHFGLNKPSSQRNAAIINISGDNKGHIWLCDVQSGLVTYNYETDAFTRYTTYNGLPSDDCRYTVFDGQETFWFNTDIGLCKYDPALKKFISYTENDGLPVLPESYLSTDRNGNMYLPYKNGYYTWNSADLNDPVKNGSVYLRDLLLFNKHLAGDTAYHFSYKENNIRVLFGLLSFNDPDKILIEYSLNDDSWLTTDIHSYISLVNLAPGTYHLTARIKNKSIPDIHIVFIIDQPFWQKWWFIVLLAAFIIVSITAITRNRVNNIRKGSSLQQKVMESEMSALRSQMNPHFIFNTLNSINSYIIENKQEEASDYLTDFSKLMRIILEHSRKRTVTLQEELYALKLYLELEWRRLEGSFDYEIIISPGIDTAAINIPPLIIQPYVENAIWHGLRGNKPGGHINIRVSNYEAGLLVVVEDNGVGRAASHKTQKVKSVHSFGTAATRQRILLNDPKSKIEIEDLYDAAGQPGGTGVNIYLNQHNS